MSKRDLDLGIDFGTTNCTACVLSRSGPDPRGPIPSLGAFQNGKFIWGQKARLELLRPNTLFTPIRDLKLHITKGEYHVGTETLSTNHLLISLLEHLVDQVHLKRDRLRSVVVGTPVNMSEPRKHRKLVERAARSVGFEQVRFIYEPTAALIGAEYDKGWLSGHHLVLVVDWGGGTLDLAVIRKEGHVYRELAVHANFNSVGGTFIDEKLTRTLLDSHPEAKEWINREPDKFEWMKESVQQAKEKLLENPFADDGDHQQIDLLETYVTLKASLVESVMHEFAEKAANESLDVLRRAGISPGEISHILFAGGVCKAEVVKEAFCSRFKGSITISDRPQLQTGIGAAVLTAADFEMQMAADFGVRQNDESICVLLPRGQTLRADRYRRAGFMVTDPKAPEAAFDFGILDAGNGTAGQFSEDGGKFQSKEQMFVGISSTEKDSISIPDEVMLCVGIDHYLTVQVEAVSNRGGKSHYAHIREIPLAVRMRRDEAEL